MIDLNHAVELRRVGVCELWGYRENQGQCCTISDREECERFMQSGGRIEAAFPNPHEKQFGLFGYTTVEVEEA